MSDLRKQLDTAIDVEQKIYEVVDVTNIDSDGYYTLGLWSTLEAAIEALDTCKTPDELDTPGYIEDYACVEIRERKYGWSDSGKVVYMCEWTTGEYDEDKDEPTWIVSKNTNVYIVFRGDNTC